ncbi:MAG TPA: MmcQ/YjbR family DNA-binding protein [Puia sp.]|nr:MmcQ/YjbR family DNA-binding protein [Puia sp.]
MVFYLCSVNIDAFHHLEIIRKYILQLPGVEEYTCLGTPAFRVNKKLLARLREDGETLVVRNEERGAWMKKNPSVYFITEHYRNYPNLLINLSKVKNNELKMLLQTAWRSRANKKQLKKLSK